MKERVFCQNRTSENQTPEWNKCPYCCAFCDEKEQCNLQLHCKNLDKREGIDCLWSCNAVEYMASRLFPDAWKETYGRRRLEKWIRNGFRRGDGTWEGYRLGAVPEKEYQMLVKRYEAKGV